MDIATFSKAIFFRSWGEPMTDLPADALQARSAEITHLLDELASTLDVNFSLSRQEQLALLDHALEIRAAFRKRAERFQAYFVPTDE